MVDWYLIVLFMCVGILDDFVIDCYLVRLVVCLHLCMFCGLLLVFV